MRLQCDVCEHELAAVMCCADEAALCLECDQRVHDANKLASKHQRVPLIIAGMDEQPKCDICQEAVAFFFCVEDRALLCRDCDVSIHTANPLAAKHQRFLLTGMRVGLEATQGAPPPEQISSPDSRNDSQSSVSPPAVPVMMNGGGGQLPASNNQIGRGSQQQQQGTRGMMARWSPAPTKANLGGTIPVVSAGRIPPRQGRGAPQPTMVARPLSPVVVSAVTTRKMYTTVPDAGSPRGVGHVGSTGSKRNSDFELIMDPDTAWRVEELLNIPDLPDGYTLGDIGPGKETESNDSEFDWAADLGLFNEHVMVESLHEVPEMNSASPSSTPSNITSFAQQRSMRVGGMMVDKSNSGRSGKLSRNDGIMSLVPEFDDSFIVPDVSSPLLSFPVTSKRRRNCC